MSKDLNEFLTRKQRIDIMLKEQGWVVGEGEKVIVEVDTKQSDFRAQNYRTVSDTLKNDMESKYVDYLLLDRFGAPIAIIEAKRTSRDPILAAQKQKSMRMTLNRRLEGMFLFSYQMDMRYGSGTGNTMGQDR